MKRIFIFVALFLSLTVQTGWGQECLHSPFANKFGNRIPWDSLYEDPNHNEFFL